MGESSRLLRFLLPWLALLIGAPALAHGFLVLGTLTSSPPTPQPNTPFTLAVKLTDVTERPVEHADIFADFSAPGSSTNAASGSTQATPVHAFAFTESAATPGTYQAQATLPDGAWSLVLRDHTFSYEESRTTPFTFYIGHTDQDGNQASYDFVFPPTTPKPATLKTWLLWVIGVPIAAGIIITVIVLLGKKKEGEEELPRET
jgi:hypothetical protein